MTSTGAGVLRPEQLARLVSLERTACSVDLERFVENYWILSWDMPPGTTHLSSTLPHPACNLTVERGSTRPEVGADPVVLTGVVTRRFDVVVRDAGWVFGVKFRPGGLTALTGAPARTIRDRTAPATEQLSKTVVAALRVLDGSRSSTDCVERVDAILGGLPQVPDESYETVLRVVADMLADRSLVRVAQVEDRHGIGRRSLERLFSDYIGVSPKWVLARYRMHDAVAELDAGYEGTLADLAARHGWYDQAHFNREFSRLVGVTPSDYLSRTEA